MPAANEVWDFEGRRVRLLRAHQHDSNVWIAETLDHSTTHYIGVPWMVENANRRMGIEGVDLPAGTAPPMEEIPTAAPAPRMTRRRATPSPAPTPAEEAVDATVNADEEQPQCPVCHARYTGVLGVNHSCDVIRNIRCRACNIVNPEHIAHPPRPPYICPACVGRGIFICKKCARPSSTSRQAGICSECDLVPEGSVWEGLRGSAVGNSIIQEVRSHRPYSVEVECFLLPASQVIPYALPGPHWAKVGDGSIRGDSGASETAEFRSPPFRGDGGLVYMHEAIKKIREMGYRANRTCGLHVHMDAIDLSTEQREQVRKFCHWIEADMFKLVARNRPTCGYCNTLQGASQRGDRYRWLNVEPAWERHRTIEVRLHHGTTQPDRAVEWTKVCLRIMEMGLRYGTLPAKPAKPLFDLLEFSTFEKNYWLDVAKSLHGDAVAFSGR